MFLFAGLSLLPSIALAQDGRVDSTFGINGRYVHSATGTTSEVVWDMATHADGKVAMVGHVYVPWNTQPRLSVGVLQIHANGTEDASFGQNGFVAVTDSNGTYESDVIAVQPDGKILVGGTSNRFSVGSMPFVMRFLPNGDLDSTFGLNGLAYSYFPFIIAYHAGDITVSPSGNIIFAGTVNLGNGNFHGSLLKYSPQGVLDQGFGTNGMSIDMQNPYVSFQESVSLTANGDIVVGGQDFRNGTGDQSLMVARYDSAGVPDSSFNGVGYYTFRNTLRWGNSMRATVDYQNRILLTGSIRAVNNDDTLVVARFLPNGTLDPSFGTNGLFLLPNFSLLPKTIATQLDGKIVIGGLNPDTSAANARALRLLGNGTLDPSYGQQGVTAYDCGTGSNFRAAHFDSDCNLYIGGAKALVMACTKFISTCPTTDFEAPKLPANLAVHPNPVQSQMVLEIELPDGVSPDGVLAVVDMQGREVLEEAWPSGNAKRLQLPSKVTPGLYMLRYSTREFSGQVKVVVQ